MKIWGADLSINHGAIVQLVNGKLDNFWYWTNVAGIAKLGKKHGARMNIKKSDSFDVERIAWVREFLRAHIERERPGYVAIEDYALNKAHGSHQIGEVGGLARLLFWDAGVRMRFHDPSSLKMFAAHDGTADKTNMRWNVENRWKPGFDQMILKGPRGKGNAQSAEDLCDAMALAQLCRIEVRLRAGKIQLSDLRHEKERRVFLRVTKTYPVNVLGREWIRKPFKIAVCNGSEVFG